MSSSSESAPIAVGDPSRVEVSLIEIFASAQGEGPEVGRSTVFVRLGGCDLRCRWCDSPKTWRKSPSCRIEKEAGRGVFSERDNPISAAEVAEIAVDLAPRKSTWISLTGGEPLLQPEAVGAITKELARRGRRAYLETHGLHADALSLCVEGIDLVSMDWKFASEVRWAPDAASRSTDDFHDAHEAFLRVATRAKSVYVKSVLTTSTRDDEFDEMLDRICAVRTSLCLDIPLVLQPVTPIHGVEMPNPENLLQWLMRAEERLSDVRMIPQTHPIYGVL